MSVVWQPTHVFVLLSASFASSAISEKMVTFAPPSRLSTGEALMWQGAQVATGTSAFGMLSVSIRVMLMWQVVQPMSWFVVWCRNLTESRLGQACGHVLNHCAALAESTPG